MGGAYLEGHGDLVIRLIIGIIGVIMWVIKVISLLTKSPWPSKYVLQGHSVHIMILRISHPKH